MGIIADCGDMQHILHVHSKSQVWCSERNLFSTHGSINLNYEYFSACGLNLKCFVFFQGGMKGVIFTDVFQAFVMLAGLLVVTIQVNQNQQ